MSCAPLEAVGRIDAHSGTLFQAARTRTTVARVVTTVVVVLLLEEVVSIVMFVRRWIDEWMGG